MSWRAHGRRSEVGPRGLDGEIATLRCAVVVAKGPSQQNDVTANSLRDERGRLAYAVCADAAACDEDEQVPAALSGEGVKLAELIRKRPERGWLHRAFPELDADALRCLRALMRAADAVDDGWALAASCSDVRKSSSSKNGAARCVSAWCACELWRTAISPKVSKRVKGADGAISERDGDGALFGAAVDVLEALISSYDAVRPYAGPANVLGRRRRRRLRVLGDSARGRARRLHGAGGVAADRAGGAGAEPRGGSIDFGGRRGRRGPVRRYGFGPRARGVGRRGHRGGGGRKDARGRGLEPGGRGRAAGEARRAGRARARELASASTSFEDARDAESDVDSALCFVCTTGLFRSPRRACVGSARRGGGRACN